MSTRRATTAPSPGTFLPGQTSDAVPPSASSVRITSTPARIGLVLAALLGAADVMLGLSQLDGSHTIPTGISAFVIAAGVVTIGAVPFAWRGAAWAPWLIIAARVVSALTALPAFFVPGVPAGFVVGAAVGIALAVLVAILLLVRSKGDRS